jgi:hypothetical protein
VQTSSAELSPKRSATNFTADGFTIWGNVTADTVAAGQAAHIAITVGASDATGFASPVTFTASGLPAGTTATFSQNPVTQGAGTVITTMTISTTPLSLSLGIQDESEPPSRPSMMVIAALATGLFLTMVARLRWGGRVGIGAALPVSAALALLIIASGCSTPPPSNTGGSGTPIGTSQVAVTATSGAATQQLIVQLTVK